MSSPEVGKKIIVTVPSTTANLGPGFDCLGAALDLYNEFITSIVFFFLMYAIIENILMKALQIFLYQIYLVQ